MEQVINFGIATENSAEKGKKEKKCHIQLLYAGSVI
jgi:hypothetical protein